ncbi:hypothetical protein PENTCL1PPCAC_25488, partial [Pristionchus entomophagus]
LRRGEIDKSNRGQVMPKPPYWPDNLMLGYNKELFPSFFIDSFHQYTGTLLQIWKEIQLTTAGSEHIANSQITKYDFDLDANDGISEGFEGIFGAIDIGEVLSCINGLSLTEPGLIRNFRYSSRVFYQTLSFFLVFWPNEIALIIICVFAIAAVNIVASRTAVRSSISKFVLSLSRFIIFPLAFAFLFIIYSAAFRGNMVIPYVSPIVTFSDMLNNICLGKWSLLTTIKMTDEETLAFADATGGAVVETVESSSGMIGRACASYRVILRIFDIERMVQLRMDQGCSLQRISPTTGHDELLRVMLTKTGDTNPYFLLFSRRRTSRRVVEYVNYALRMSSEDQMNRFWNVRFMRERGTISLAALKRYQQSPPDPHRYDPITLLQISPVFGLAITALVFCTPHRRIAKALRKSRKEEGQWVVPHDRLPAVFD